QGVAARAQVVDGEFLVLAGSTSVPLFSASEDYSESTARAYAAYSAQHADLIDKGVLELSGDVATFVKDAPFGSPSTAGAIVLGRSCNGRVSWVTDQGVQFGAW